MFSVDRAWRPLLSAVLELPNRINEHSAIQTVLAPMLVDPFVDRATLVVLSPGSFLGSIEFEITVPRRSGDHAALDQFVDHLISDNADEFVAHCRISLQHLHGFLLPR